MKKLGLLLLAGFFFAACNDDSKTAETTTEDSTNLTTTGGNTTTDVNAGYANVPASTKTSFETKYPGATNVNWRRYNPDNYKTDVDDDWRKNLDTSDYEVSFRFNDVDYWAWYDNGEWYYETMKMTDHAKLPAAVNSAIQKSYKDYKITEVDVENDKNRRIYEVDLEKDGEKWNIHFDENGKVVKSKGPDGKAKPE